MVVSGREYLYYVQAYDENGQQGLPSNIVAAELSDWRATSTEEKHA